MNYTTLQVQTRLKQLGFDPGNLDGLPGPKTDRAIIAFKKSKGLAARAYLGPITLQALFGTPAAGNEAVPTFPWMNEINKHMGLHESRDFAKLFAWLKSDGRTLGDPRKLPWCGDAVDTAIRLGLPNEPFTGRVKVNPYLARNWLDFGVPCHLAYGAVGAFWRGDPNGTSGHVGFIVGRNVQNTAVRVRGGNQGNTVSDAWLTMDRLLGTRWPKTYAGPPAYLPVLDSKGQPMSRNEA